MLQFYRFLSLDTYLISNYLVHDPISFQSDKLLSIIHSIYINRFSKIKKMTDEDSDDTVLPSWTSDLKVCMDSYYHACDKHIQAKLDHLMELRVKCDDFSEVFHLFWKYFL